VVHRRLRELAIDCRRSFSRTGHAGDHKRVIADYLRAKTVRRCFAEDSHCMFEHFRGLATIAPRQVVHPDRTQHRSAAFPVAARVGECKFFAAREHVVDGDRLVGFRRHRH
jgi:hypothetical protein